MFYLQTPGGGGYGSEQELKTETRKRKQRSSDEGSNAKKGHSLVGRGSVFEYKKSQESA